MRCFQLCFPVLISSSLSLITPALLLFSSRWWGTVQECVVVYDVGGVSTARRGWVGRESPCPLERAEPCHQIHSLHPWHPPDEQIQLLPCHFSSLCCSIVGLSGEHSPGGHRGHAATSQWVPAFPLCHHPHKALMTLQVTLHSQRFSNPHAWLQKDTSPSKGQSRQ